MKSTIGAARRRLDEMLGLSPAQRRVYQRYIEEVARNMHHGLPSIDERAARLAERINADAQRLDELEGEAHLLAGSITDDRRGYARDRQRLTTHGSAYIDQMVSYEQELADLEAAKNDPEAAIDAMLAKNPVLQPDWPF